MIQFNVVTLIAENPAAHGVYETAAPIERTVYCTAKSVGMQEMYAAQSQGLSPSAKLVLSHKFEYQGEKRCRYNGEEYDILRTYGGEKDGIELTIQKRRAENADLQSAAGST